MPEAADHIRSRINRALTRLKAAGVEPKRICLSSSAKSDFDVWADNLLRRPNGRSRRVDTYLDLPVVEVSGSCSTVGGRVGRTLVYEGI